VSRYDGFADIVGKTVDAVYFNVNRGLLALVTSDGATHVYEAEGDCCANAYFEAPEQAGFDQIVGHEVTACEERDGGDFDGGDEVNSITFYSIKTARGMADVEMRVSHIGYYGGMVVQSAVVVESLGPPAWKLLAGQRRCIKHDDCRANRGLGIACAQAVRP